MPQKNKKEILHILTSIGDLVRLEQQCIEYSIRNYLYYEFTRTPIYIFERKKSH